MSCNYTHILVYMYVFLLKLVHVVGCELGALLLLHARMENNNWQLNKVVES